MAFGAVEKFADMETYEGQDIQHESHSDSRHAMESCTATLGCKAEAGLAMAVAVWARYERLHGGDPASNAWCLYSCHRVLHCSNLVQTTLRGVPYPIRRRRLQLSAADVDELTPDRALMNWILCTRLITDKTRPESDRLTNKVDRTSEWLLGQSQSYIVE
jgi:hypothetical protein